MPFDPLKYLVGLIVKTAGVNVSRNAKSINFTGAGQTTTSSNDDVTVDISAGGGEQLPVYAADDGVTVSVTSGQGTGGGAPGDLSITSGNGSQSSDGGQIDITSGDGGDEGSGGHINIKVGDSGNVSGDGGNLTLEAGISFTSGSGGSITLLAGEAQNGNGGAVDITGGDGNADDGGFITLTGGSAQGAFTPGGIILEAGNGEDYGGELSFIVTDGLVLNGLITTDFSGDYMRSEIGGSKTTTNATPFIDTSSAISMLGGTSTAFVELTCTAQRTGGTSGSAGDSAAYKRTALYKQVSSGSPTLVGSVQSPITIEDQAGWDATLVISGSTINVQVTGATDNTIRWQWQLTYTRG